MSEVELPYGTETITLSLPDRDRIRVIDPGGQTDEEPLSNTEVDRHFTRHLADRMKRVLAEDGSRIVFAIPDHTRDAAQAVVVERFVKLFREVDPGGSHLTILVASGRHRAPSVDQMERLVTPEVRALDRVETVAHDAFRDEELRSTGGRVDDVKIRLNRRVFDASLLVLYGRVTFHYLAGFGGGAKMLCPGLGGEATIRAVHRRTLRTSASEERRRIGPGIYDGNPMQQAIRGVPERLTDVPTVGIQCVGTKQRRPVSLITGSVIESHRRAVEAYRGEHEVQVSGEFDLLLLSPGGSPADVDLIQSHKALQHTRSLYGSDTCVVLFAACPEGFGADEMEDWLCRGEATTLRKDLQEDFEVYGRTAMALREIAEETELYLVTDGDVSAFRSCGLNVFDSWESVRERIERDVEGSREVLVLPDASSARYSSSSSSRDCSRE